MAIVQLKTCVAEGDLANALLNFNQQVGDVTRDILNQITALPTDGLSDLMDQGQAILDKEIQPTTSNALMGAVGLPLPHPTNQIQANEERLEPYGIYMIDGVLYLKGGDNNIENFRRLYFAVGSNLSKFLQVINSTDKFALIQTYLVVQQLPLGQQWTVVEAQALYKNNAIENVYLAGDGYYYCVVPNFLGINISKQTAANQHNLPVEQISTQIFWLSQISTDNATINQLQALGLNADEINAALSGTRLIDTLPSVYADQAALVNQDAGQALSQSRLFESRYAKINQSARDSFQQSIAQSISKTQTDLFILQDNIRFYGTLLTTPADIATFLTRNSQADLVYLFTQRRNIIAIDFTATNAQIIKIINQVLGVQAGNTSTSSIIANNQPNNPQNLDPTINQTNQQLVSSYCASNEFSAPQIKLTKLLTSISCLQSILTQTSTTSTVTTPPVVQGYQSFDSPATTLALGSDILLSLNTDAITNALEALAAGYTGIFKVLIELLASLVRSMKAAMNQVVSSMRAQIESIMNKVNAFVSQFMSLHGTASLDSSLLKCSFNFNISPNLTIFTELEKFLDQMIAKVNNLIAGLVKVVYDFVNKLLCLPLNLFNGFMANVQNNLPSFCSLYKVTLPADIEKEMIQIRDTFQLQGNVYSAFSRDLVRVNVTVQATPQKLKQFKQNLVCQNPASTGLFGSISTAIGLGSNPLNGIAKAVI
jgi:hypothetical protein